MTAEKKVSSSVDMYLLTSWRCHSTPEILWLSSWWEWSTKSHAITVLGLIWFYILYYLFCKIGYCVFDAYMFRPAIYSQRIVNGYDLTFHIFSGAFCFKVYLVSFRITMPASFLDPSAWNIFFYPFTLRWYLSLISCFFCKQQKARFCFLMVKGVHSYKMQMHLKYQPFSIVHCII